MELEEQPNRESMAALQVRGQGVTSEELIKTLPADLVIKLLEQALEKGSGTSGITRITIEDLIEKHKIYVEAKEFCKGTIAIYERAYRYFQRYTKDRGIQYADEVTYDNAEEFYNFMKRDPGFSKKGVLSSKYIISTYKCIKAVFAYAERRGYIVKNRFENKVFQQCQVSDWWTDEYVKQLVAAIKKYTRGNKRFVTVLKVLLTYTTGLRPGVIHGIKRKGVIIEGDKIYVNTKCKVAKSAKIQRITTPILNRDVIKMMKIHIERLDRKGIKQEEYIFANNNAKTAYEVYRKSIILACKKAGIQYKSPHKAKHGFITKMAINGLSAEQICKMTGNLTPRLIQEVYMHLQIGNIQERVEELVNE